MSSVDRNAQCICGSSKKFKKCCLKKYEEERSPLSLMEHASRYPVDMCLIRKNWEDDGLACIVIVRKNTETERFLVATVLVDTWYKGVKGAFGDAHLDEQSINAFLQDIYGGYSMVDSEYEYCRGLVFGAIDFAKNLSEEPHLDWETVKEFFDWNKPYQTQHLFGKNGKPFFVPGPDD